MRRLHVQFYLSILATLAIFVVASAIFWSVTASWRDDTWSANAVAQFAQLILLMSRYWKVKIRDRAGAAIMFLQAPIIGIMLAFVFYGQQKAVPFWCLGALQELGKRMPATGQNSSDLLSRMLPTEDHTAAMFFVVVSAVWFGTSNSAREIVTCPSSSGCLNTSSVLRLNSGSSSRNRTP